MKELFYAPRPANLPHIHILIDNIAKSEQAIANYLQLSKQTIKGYIKAGQAPRPVHLALFWESSWGMGAINANAINHATRWRMEAEILRSRNKKLEEIIQMLETERGQGQAGMAANAPFLRA